MKATERQTEESAARLARLLEFVEKMQFQPQRGTKDAKGAIIRVAAFLLLSFLRLFAANPFLSSAPGLELARECPAVGVVSSSGTRTRAALHIFAAALDPCPCGFHGDPKRECRCSPLQVQRYRERISGPLLDRIDIHLEFVAITYNEMAGKDLVEGSESLRERVVQAREIQRKRFGKKSKVRCNARMSPKQIKVHCERNEAGEGMIQMAMTELNLSARANDRILKVSRTIADLAGSEQVQVDHVAEAIKHRTLDRSMWS